MTSTAPPDVVCLGKSMVALLPARPGRLADVALAAYLSATLRGLPVRDRLRHGHLPAALTIPANLAPPPKRAYADPFVALPEDAWGGLRLAPGWTTGPPGRVPADEEPSPDHTTRPEHTACPERTTGLAGAAGPTHTAGPATR